MLNNVHAAISLMERVGEAHRQSDRNQLKIMKAINSDNLALKLNLGKYLQPGSRDRSATLCVHNVARVRLHF
jgi:hypothetical protein